MNNRDRETLKAIQLQLDIVQNQISQMLGTDEVEPTYEAPPLSELEPIEIGDTFYYSRIRNLITQGFDTRWLKHELIYDSTEFKGLYSTITPNDSIVNIADKIIDYAHSRMLFGVLLGELKRKNPSRYETMGPYSY